MTERKGPWIQVYSGRAIYPFDPRVEDVDIADIAHALAGEPRFGSHTRVFGYSVAEHSVRGSFEVPEVDAASFLFHDASEAYLRDMLRPIKMAPEARFYRNLESDWMAVIRLRFGLLPYEPVAVKYVDLRMLATEKRDLMGPEPMPWGEMPEPFPGVIAPWGSERAEARFLVRYLELVGKGLCK
jgi:hypothetical protein